MNTQTESRFETLDKPAFEQLFKTYFTSLCSFARKYVYDVDTSQEIVHHVFINLWQKREEVALDTSLKSYLFRSVHNRCLNHIRDHKKFVQYDLPTEGDQVADYIDSSDYLEVQELEATIQDAIASLPDACRKIFMMSRFEELKYKEIAEKLNISVKTVETQMSKALKILKEKLAEHLVIWLIVFWHCL